MKKQGLHPHNIELMPLWLTDKPHFFQENREEKGDKLKIMKIVTRPSAWEVGKYSDNFEEEAWETWENED